MCPCTHRILSAVFGRGVSGWKKTPRTSGFWEAFFSCKNSLWKKLKRWKTWLFWVYEHFWAIVGVVLLKKKKKNPKKCKTLKKTLCYILQLTLLVFFYDVQCAVRPKNEPKMIYCWKKKESILYNIHISKWQILKNCTLRLCLGLWREGRGKGGGRYCSKIWFIPIIYITKKVFHIK